VVNVTGLLDLSNLSAGNKFNINLWTLNSIGPDVNGSAINFTPGNSYSWNIANYGSITNFNANFFNINTNAVNGTAGFANAINPNGSFSLTTSNNSLWLNYTGGSVPSNNSVLGILGTTFASGTNAIITGGANAFSVSVTNGPGADTALTLTGTSSTNVSGTITSTTVAAGAATNASGLSFTGTTVGTNVGTFTLTAPGASNSPLAGSVTNVVYDHASGSLASNVISVGSAHVGYSNVLTGSVTASNAAGFRVDLTAPGLANGDVNLSGISGLAAGGVTNVTATVATGREAGAINSGFDYSYGDDSTLNGAVTSLADLNITVTGGIYAYAAGAVASTNINLGNIHAGESFGTNNIVVSNTATGPAGYVETLAAAFTNGNGVATAGSVNALAAGSNSSVLSVTLTNNTAGAQTGTVDVAFTSQEVSNSGLGNTKLNTTNMTVTGGVYAYAAGAVASTNINLGNIHVGANFGTNNIVVSNTATGPDGYVETLAAAFTNGSGVNTAGIVSGLTAGNNSTAMSVTLTNNAAGAQSGSVGVAFTSQEVGGSSLGNTLMNTTNITVTGFVYTGQGVWNTNGGSWATYANWQQAGGTPGIDGVLSANDTATFGTGGSGTVTLDGTSPSLQSVTFSNSAASYTIASGTGSSALTLKDGDAAASINNHAGNHVISASLNLANDVTLNSVTNTSLNISGTIGGVGGLTKSGSGTATLSAANTFSGTTLVSSGTLIIDGGTTNSATIVDNSGTLGGRGELGSVTVLNGGTLAPSIGGTTSQMSVESLALQSGSTVNMLLNGTNAGAYDSIFSSNDIVFGGRLNVAVNGGTYNDSNNIGLFQLFASGAGITGGLGNNFSDVFVSYGSYSGFLSFYEDVNRWQVWDKNSDSYIGLNMADGSFLVIPEPSTYALLGLGAIVMVVAYRRKQKAIAEG